ncbi:hypothetical protein HNR23_003400 [Nocardiopsis mwathae]|uniref:DUF5753 domain-containing protein n=2 Tax=Nocardiopsis mwathae TaxID=1472723 RepID=A0A7W9YI00_9ACTN|nr:hypothetical protein [Nocardiopsis mwathae]MBB6173340.1 hypothetical protein [Nocardiopsis mwathae]
MERGARGIKREHTRHLDRELNTGGALTELWDRLSESALAPGYQDAAELERAASEIWEFHQMVVPGLLQTEEYARHILRTGLPRDTPDSIEELVQIRMKRQELLKSDEAPALVFVLDESVLRRPTGGREIMARQLANLLEKSQRPKVAIQVIPFATTDHPGLSEAFELFKVPGQGVILYLETRREGTIVHDLDAVDDYSRLFGDLRGAALPLDATRQLIATVQGEFS